MRTPEEWVTYCETLFPVSEGARGMLAVVIRDVMQQAADREREAAAVACEERSERAMVIYRSYDERIARGDGTVSIEATMALLDESTTAINLAHTIRAQPLPSQTEPSDAIRR